MAVSRLGIIMHGVTGRMGLNQHLIRSILAIRAQGGVALANGDRVMPDPIIVGRNGDKLAAIAKAQSQAIAQLATQIATLSGPGRSIRTSTAPIPRIEDIFSQPLPPLEGS